MEISNTILIQFLSVLLSGLVAGLFFGWQVSVIPGNKLVANDSYLETMQKINREILNPLFYLVFIGSVPVLIINTVYQYLQSSATSFWISVAAAIIHLVGVFMVTGLGNVPMNNKLDKQDLAPMSEHDMAKFRIWYESKWNSLHTIRTVSSILAFALLVVTSFI
jgi:uncharacterized membrane protein